MVENNYFIIVFLMLSFLLAGCGSVVRICDGSAYNSYLAKKQQMEQYNDTQYVLANVNSFSRVTYSEWKGDKIYDGGGGVVDAIDGIELWSTGLPSGKYIVIGVINLSYSSEYAHLLSEYNKSQVVKLTKNNRGDGVFLTNKTSNDSIISNSFIVFRYTAPINK